MDNKNNYLLNLVIASAAIATTLFVLNKYWNRNFNKSSVLPGDGGIYNNTDMPVTGSRPFTAVDVQKVQIVEEERCLFPDAMLVDYEVGSWDSGQLNDGAPDFPNNKF